MVPTWTMFGRVAGPCPVLTGCAGIADAVATGAIMACPVSADATDPPMIRHTDVIRTPHEHDTSPTPARHEHDSVCRGAPSARSGRRTGGRRTG
jgi:hypothetical protein